VLPCLTMLYLAAKPSHAGADVDGLPSENVGSQRLDGVSREFFLVPGH
jgi:hypothetical protein